MITKEKLALNLVTLKQRLPTKPKVFSPKYPKTIRESLQYYCNRRTVHGLQFATVNLSENNWPLPWWINPEKIRIGFWNKLNYQKWWKALKVKKNIKTIEVYDFFAIIVINQSLFKRPIDEVMIEAFSANRNYAFARLSTNPILQSKKEIMKSIQLSYKKCNWIACITTLLSLIDYVTRKLLKTENLSMGVLKICQLFEQNGFSLETANNLMPFSTIVQSHFYKGMSPMEEIEKLHIKLEKTDFGIIGPALSSFIRFANIYYSYYKSDSDSAQTMQINRHAILHGSISNFGSITNTVKVITFLYLMLELEPVFDILLAE